MFTVMIQIHHPHNYLHPTGSVQGQNILSVLSVILNQDNAPVNSQHICDKYL